MARRPWRLSVAALVAMICFPALLAAEQALKIPPNSKVSIVPMNGFEDYLIAGFQQKKLPVMVVADREQADYEITGTPEIQKVEGTKGWAAVAEVALTKGHSGDYFIVRASWIVKSVKTGNVVFAYSVEKSGSHPQQSAAEAFAKHFKDHMSKK